MGDGPGRENEEKEEKMGGPPLDERGDHISDLVRWHMADALRRCSETVCYLKSYRQCQCAT